MMFRARRQNSLNGWICNYPSGYFKLKAAQATGHNPQTNRQSQLDRPSRDRADYILQPMFGSFESVKFAGRLGRTFVWALWPKVHRLRVFFANRGVQGTEEKIRQEWSGGR